MLKGQQRPKYLWIGCSDSRVPANEIVGLPPGEVFVHRNVANLVVDGDLNATTAIEYATEALGVRDIIVCGHYGCGGVAAALQPAQGRPMDRWIGHIRDLARRHEGALREVAEGDERARRLCELNVTEQVTQVRHSPPVDALRSRGIEVAVHGWIYDIADGRLKDLLAAPVR